MFLRGYGSQNHTKKNGEKIGNSTTTHTSSGLNTIQGDAIRDMKGDLNSTEGNFAYFKDYVAGNNTRTGVFGTARWDKHPFRYSSNGDYQGYIGGFWFYANHVVPVANENRPVNMAVKYIIRAQN